MSKIIISYRRSNSAPVAGRIFDQLVQHYGKDRCSWTSTAFRLASTFASTSKATNSKKPRRHRAIAQCSRGCDGTRWQVGSGAGRGDPAAGRVGPSCRLSAFNSVGASGRILLHRGRARHKDGNDPRSSSAQDLIRLLGSLSEQRPEIRPVGLMAVMAMGLLDFVHGLHVQGSVPPGPGHPALP